MLTWFLIYCVCTLAAYPIFSPLLYYQFQKIMFSNNISQHSWPNLLKNCWGIQIHPTELEIIKRCLSCFMERSPTSTPIGKCDFRKKPIEADSIHVNSAGICQSTHLWLPDILLSGKQYLAWSLLSKMMLEKNSEIWVQMDLHKWQLLSFWAFRHLLSSPLKKVVPLLPAVDWLHSIGPAQEWKSLHRQTFVKDTRLLIQENYLE